MSPSTKPGKEVIDDDAAGVLDAIQQPTLLKQDLATIATLPDAGAAETATPDSVS